MRLSVRCNKTTDLNCISTGKRKSMDAFYKIINSIDILTSLDVLFFLLKF